MTDFCADVTTLFLQLLGVIQANKNDILEGVHARATMQLDYMADREGQHANPITFSLEVWVPVLGGKAIQNHTWEAEELLLFVGDLRAHYRAQLRTMAITVQQEVVAISLGEEP